MLFKYETQESTISHSIYAIIMCMIIFTIGVLILNALSSNKSNDGLVMFFLAMLVFIPITIPIIATISYLSIRSYNDAVCKKNPSICTKE